MHFWKGAKFAGFVGHPMTKMLSASGGFAPWPGALPWTPLGALPPDPRYRLVLHTRHAPRSCSTDPFLLWPPWKKSYGCPCRAVELGFKNLVFFQPWPLYSAVRLLLCMCVDKLYHLCREVQCRNAMLSCITTSLGLYSHSLTCVFI